MKKAVKLILIAAGATIALASVLTWPQSSADSNKPILAGARIPANVRSLVDAGCRDCHSEATRYPWYSYIAPMSILVQNDVKEGRERLNFSKWADYPSVRRQRALSEIANQVQDGGMPLPIYVWLHPSAKFTAADKNLIFEWTQAERARLIAEGLTP